MHEKDNSDARSGESDIRRQRLTSILREDLELDLKISRQMVDLIIEDTPLRRYHQGRLEYLANLLSQSPPNDLQRQEK
jgi:hypothetical protein